MAHFKAVALAGAAAVAMSGCSWMGLGSGKVASGPYAQQGGAYGAPGQNGFQGAFPGAGGAQPGPQSCQIPSPRHPVPPGCDPASVTIGVGFAQQPQFGTPGAPSFATGGYGQAVGQQAAAIAARPEYRKPRFRGTLSTGIEKSVAGEYLDFQAFQGIDPEALYNPSLYNQTSIEGSVASGTVVRSDYTAIVEAVNKPTVSNDDVHSTPATIAAGLEYILSPRTTVFGNAGYTYSEGNEGTLARIDGELQRTDTESTYDLETAVLLNRSSSPTAFIPNVENIASFEASYSDLNRIDLEAGARHYLNPLRGFGMDRVTPFVSAAAGASHYNRQSLDLTQRQASYRPSFEQGGVTEGNIYEVVPADVAMERVELYGAQWVPSGQLNAGVEWQATPSTAVAFETGLRVKGGREYTNGQREGADISIPLTIRGSYNF